MEDVQTLLPARRVRKDEAMQNLVPRMAVLRIRMN